MKKIFLLSGQAESGKNTVANIIQGKLDGKSIEIAMADYLKIMAKKYYNWNGRKNSIGRSILQKLGTDRIRDELGWESFHVDRVCQDIHVIKNDFDYVFVPDVRFRNEMYHTIAEFPDEVVTIHVDRLNHTSKLTEEQLKHRSENDLKGVEYDYNLSCGEGVESVEKEVDDVLGGLIMELNKEKFFKRYS